MATGAAAAAAAATGCRPNPKKRKVADKTAAVAQESESDKEDDGAHSGDTDDEDNEVYADDAEWFAAGGDRERYAVLAAKVLRQDAAKDGEEDVGDGDGDGDGEDDSAAGDEVETETETKRRVECGIGFKFIDLQRPADARDQGAQLPHQDPTTRVVTQYQAQNVFWGVTTGDEKQKHCLCCGCCVDESDVE